MRRALRYRCRRAYGWRARQKLSIYEALKKELLQPEGDRGPCLEAQAGTGHVIDPALVRLTVDEAVRAGPGGP